MSDDEEMSEEYQTQLLHMRIKHQHKDIKWFDAKLKQMEDRRFEEIQAAYIRGYSWSLENPDSQAFVHKAAYDYADKATSQNFSADEARELKQQANSVSMEERKKRGHKVNRRLSGEVKK